MRWELWMRVDNTNDIELKLGSGSKQGRMMKKIIFEFQFSDWIFLFHFGMFSFCFSRIYSCWFRYAPSFLPICFKFCHVKRLLSSSVRHFPSSLLPNLGCARSWTWWQTFRDESEATAGELKWTIKILHYLSALVIAIGDCIHLSVKDITTVSTLPSLMSPTTPPAWNFHLLYADCKWSSATQHHLI